MERWINHKRAARRVLGAFALVLAMAGSARAQAIGQIFGKATDESGGVLPGVTVTVSGPGLQQPLVAVTTSTGAYSFPKVPIGTYTVTFELSSFKKVSRPGVVLTTGFSAMIDQKMEVGTMTTEVNVSAASPVVDTKRTNTGGTFSREVLENVPTARDPFQIINMAPGVTLSGINVGGASSGQQLTPTVYGTSNNVQWNIEGGNTTDLSSNGSALYYNFDSFQEIQVVTGGGDVSVQSSGLFINLVTKSGSNVFKGSATATFQNDAMQGQNVSESLFNSGGSNGTGLSGNPIHKLNNYSAEFGGPILRNRLWFWGSADQQDINVGILNFFDTTRSECNPPPSGYANLQAVQGCLKNDRTLIRDLNGKVNYQLNSANRFQFLFTTDNKVRNARSASANTAPEATYQQYSPHGIFGDFTPQLTHTLVVSDKLVFTNQMTFVDNVFSLDFQDWARCGQTKPGETISDPTCLYNVQTLRNRTTGYFSRGPNSVSYFERPTWEVKTDGSYFLSNKLGGDHQLKFGVGWRDARTLSYVHYGGGTTNAYMQCVGNVAANCGASLPVPVGSTSGLVPYQGIANRDTLSNVDWWTWSSYIQDSYSKGKMRLNGGVRQDFQNSKLLGGCVDANVIVPNLLPGQCQDPADPHHSFNNFSPRGSAVFDLRGDGKTAISASGSYYYDTRNAQAGSLNNLSAISLTWGSNQSSGACAAPTASVPNPSCWNDANADGFIQANELIGTPTSSSSRFDPATGIINNVVPTVDANLKIGRTREFVTGIDHELLPQVHTRVEFVYRRYDWGSQSYLIGYQPGQPGFTAPSLFTDRQTYTDPITGKSAPYYTVCQGCTIPTGTSISTTSPNYQTYKGINVTVEKRLSHRWHMQSAFTYNINRNFSELSSYQSPTGFEFSNGTLSGGRFVVKVNGSVNLPWGLRSGANFQSQDGGVRNSVINGPGQVYGGVGSTINLTTLSFEEQGQHHLPVVNLLDANLAKTFNLNKRRQQLSLTLDCFNVFNSATIRSYSANNLSAPTTYNQVTGILAPRVFRVMAKIAF